MSTPSSKAPRVFNPASFHVDPTLRGLPLAGRSQRLIALLIDLGLIAVLTQTGSFTLPTLCALLVLWLSIRNTRGWRKALQGCAGSIAAVLVFSLVLGFTWQGSFNYGPTTADWMTFGAGVGSQDPEEQRRAIELLESQMAESFSQERLAEALQPYGVDLDVEEDPQEPISQQQVIALLQAQLSALDTEEPLPLDQVRQALKPWVAGEELESAHARHQQLVRELAEVTGRNQQLREQLDNPSMKYLAQAVATDLGLTMGWAGLYFTLFLALAAGRTTGKYLMHLRVARVDGSPLTTWSSFERFAGYAAGIATGLLGFLQIFWDRNGQTVQDTIAGTVVLDDRKSDES